MLIETDNNKISFYRDWIFDELVSIHIDCNEFMVKPIEEVSDEWCINEEGVDVKRTVIEL